MENIDFYVEKELKNSPIRRIPKDWKVVLLKEISLKIKAGGTPRTTKQEYYLNGTIPFVKIEDLTNNGKYLKHTKLKITKLGLENSSAWLVPENSLLLAMYGSLGEVSINKIKVATNQAILGIIPKKELVNLEFLYYWFSYFKPKWANYAKMTTQANLTRQIVANSPIPLPPLSEQKTIAGILKTIDDLIEVIEKLIETYERIKKGLMQVMFIRGFPPRRDEDLKDSPIGKIPREWEVKKIKEVFNIYVGGDAKKIHLSTVKTNVFKYPVFSNSIENQGLYGYTDTYQYPPNSVTITARGTLGYPRHRRAPPHL